MLTKKPLPDSITPILKKVIFLYYYTQHITENEADLNLKLCDKIQKIEGNKKDYPKQDNKLPERNLSKHLY